jgi:hypothetical protein
MRPELPKEEEEETLRRCSGKMLFISIMREKQSTVLCVYFFLIIRIPSPNGRDGTGVSVTGQEIHLALLFTITERGEEKEKGKKEKRNHNN